MPQTGIIHILDSTSNKPRPLTLTSNVLSTNDSNARSSLASIDSKITACDTSSLATSALQTAGNSSLSSIQGSLSGTLAVSDSTAQSSLTSIDNRLGGTIATSTTLSVSKSSTTVSSASSVTSGDLSLAHNCTNHRKVAIFGTTTDTSNNIEIHVSVDGSTYYKYGSSSMYPMSDGAFSAFLEAPFTHIKLKYGGSATVTAIIAGVD